MIKINMEVFPEFPDEIDTLLDENWTKRCGGIQRRTAYKITLLAVAIVSILGVIILEIFSKGH